LGRATSQRLPRTSSAWRFGSHGKSRADILPGFLLFAAKRHYEINEDIFSRDSALPLVPLH